MRSGMTAARRIFATGNAVMTAATLATAALATARLARAAFATVKLTRALIVAVLIAATLLTAASLVPPAHAQGRYTLDTDPVRLGDKALEKSNLDEAKGHYEEAVANDYEVDRAYHGLAEIALREGRWEDAEANYRRALAAAGGRLPEARAELGLLLLRLGRDLEGRQEIEQALEADGDVWAAHYGKARLHLRDEKWEQARKELEHGADRKGVAQGEDKYHYGRALYLLGTGNVEEAEKSALIAMHMNPTDPEYGALVARIYAMQGDTPLAIDAYEQALATPGMEPTAPMLHALGNLYERENRFNDARDRYERAVAIDSTYAPALRDLADLFARADRHELAARTYLRYVELRSEDLDAWLALSRSLYELGRYGQAVQTARAARKLAAAGSPEATEARFAFARAGIHVRDDAVEDEAAAIMTEAMDAGADRDWRAVDLVALADWQTKRQQFGAARRNLDRAAELDPNLFEIPFQRGVVALRMGQPATAVDDFRRAAELNPESAAVHLNLGIAAYQAGQMSVALPALRAAVERDPERTVARLLLAQVLAATDQISEAEQQYEQVLAQEPKNAKALRGLGFCRIRQADYQGAVEAYQAAAAIEPDDADSWAGLGSAHLGLEHFDQAEQAFAKARAIDPDNVMLQRGTELLEQARSAGKENEPR